MQVLEKKREEIEAKVNTMSDFLKMEYLESCVRSNPDINVCKYCYKRLSELYENKIMYSEAVKYIAKFEELCVGSKEKITAVVKEAELLIKSGQYDPADYLYKKAMALSDTPGKFEIKRNMIEFYKKEATNFELSGKSTGALKIYEKLVHYVADAERDEVRKKMLRLYQNLGKIKDYIRLKTELEKSS
jgi:tetratricopeptide (TPR) repeat protein